MTRKRKKLKSVVPTYVRTWKDTDLSGAFFMSYAMAKFLAESSGRPDVLEAAEKAWPMGCITMLTKDGRVHIIRLEDVP